MTSREDVYENADYEDGELEWFLDSWTGEWKLGKRYYPKPTSKINESYEYADLSYPMSHFHTSLATSMGYRWNAEGLLEKINDDNQRK